jgi:hypothetical protein
MLSSMKELVKHVSSLANVCGDKPAYSLVAKASSGVKASSGTLMDVVDTDMLNRLTHPQLVELHNKFLRTTGKGLKIALGITDKIALDDILK